MTRILLLKFLKPKEAKADCRIFSMLRLLSLEAEVPQTDNLGLIKELAEALRSQGVNAEWAVSRPVVDEGIVEYARQVGQTGKTITSESIYSCRYLRSNSAPCRNEGI